MSRKASAASGRAPSLLALAHAISVAEGYGVPGALPTVRNNPGDLKLTGNLITAFASPDDGWNALYHQLEIMRDGASAFYSPDMTLAQMGRIWTATEQSAWLANVIASMRSQGYDVDESTRLGDVLA